MLNILLKIPFYKAFYYFKWPKIMPMNYTVNVSFHCNSRCATCNAWKMPHDNDLTLDEWKKVFTSLGKSPYWITFSGGEPFLRSDIVDMVSSAYNICQPKIINIPTNSLMGAEFISQKVQAICDNCPNADLVLNLSLDGVAGKHDEIRGREGNFAKVLAVYKALRQIKNKNLSIGIHSVVSKFNYSHIRDLYDYVAREIKPDQYISEIAEQRKELGTIGKDITPNYEEYSLAIDYLLEHLASSHPKKIGRLTKHFRVEYYQMVKKWLLTDKQIFSCYAGVASAQINPQGEVWPCCVRADDLGNLRDHNYDFKKVWFSSKADQIRASIKNKECSCPLANAAYSTMLCDIKTLFKISCKLILNK
ncbi:MAG: radical SAM protein [Patescibacteria group bacterium]